MTQKERLIYLIEYLMAENAQGDTIEIEPLLPLSEKELMTMFRGLVNLRLPYPISEEFLKIQDDFLQEWHVGRDKYRLEDLDQVAPSMYLYQGDITQLEVDAVVNAANSEFLGCFIPNHHCIDNEIQSKGGYQIRLDVAKIRKDQGRKEPIGKAKMTPAHNLPSKYIIHTVAPISMGQVSPIKAQMLASCYRQVLVKADEEALKSVAFCCLGTGQFGFPKKEACDIAVETVEAYLQETGSDIQVIFNVFEDIDRHLYQEKFKVK